MVASFECRNHVPLTPTEAFDLARDVDVHLATMAASGERAVAGRTSGRLEPGDEVTWRARHLGMHWEMRVRIATFDQPDCFVDEQVSGPFRWFRHEHRFEAAGDATTVVVDRVSFAAPYGPVSRLVEPLLARYLRRLVCRRSAALAEHRR